MYTSFNLQIDLADIILLPFEELRQYTKTGCERKEFIESEIGSNLKEYVKDGVIDGSKLSDKWFKTIKSDVFISYSHNDEEIAMALSGYLEKEFGLNIFVDSFFWGSADALLVSVKYSCGFPDPQVLPIIVVDRYLDYFTTIMEDRLWQVLAKPVFRWRNRSGLSMNAARAA